MNETIPPTGKTAFALMTAARFLLGITMATYAMSKIVTMQFQVSSFTYARPLGVVGGRSLLWATMGYSPWFQVLLGVLELVPAILLLISRTRRIGALLMLPVTVNVMLLNYALGLWGQTKVISTTLVVLNVFLVVYDRALYATFLRQMVAQTVAGSVPSRRARVLSVFVPVLCIGVFGGFLANAMRTQANASDFVGSRQINGRGTWKLLSVTDGGQEVSLEPDSHLYFDVFGECIGGKPGASSHGTFENDAKRHTIRIDKLQIAGGQAPINATYAVSGNDLVISGLRDGKPFVMTLERDYW